MTNLCAKHCVTDLEMLVCGQMPPTICLQPWTIQSPKLQKPPSHYNDAIMRAVASQITSLTIVYSNDYSGADQAKHQSSASLAPVIGEFPAQRASYAENVSIWWRHHAKCLQPWTIQSPNSKLHLQRSIGLKINQPPGKYTHVNVSITKTLYHRWSAVGVPQSH